jgi:PRC-barrel domain protein
MPVTLPGPEVTHRWQGRTLVDHGGEPLGSVEAIYLDKATGQPEWALLEAGASSPSRTYVPLVSANEEGDTVRVPFAKTLIEGAPGMAADRELSEDQEQELYRHYGVPYSRADSPSGLPAGEPEPTESALAAGGPQPAEAPVSPSTLGVAAGKPEVTAEEPTTAAEEPLPADGGARPEAAVPESAPIPTSAVGPAPGRVDATVSEASATNEGLVATRPLRVTNARVGAGAAALALAVGIWRRRTIGRQLGTAVGRLGAIPATVSRRRRRRRRAKALNQAVTAATQQSTALARGMARLVTGTALLPVTVVVRGGRGMRAAGQATGKAISQGARRVRPGRRRRRRRGGTLGMAIGGAAGYVLGAKAGRERYEQLVEAARRWRQRPEVKRLSEQALARLDQLSDQAADKLQAARQSTGAETSSSGGQPTTVVPETPTVTPPAPTAVPPVELATMPAEPPVPPGEDASAAEERQRPAPPGPLP